jgi:lysophospholipase L1-like esterase
MSPATKGVDLSQRALSPAKRLRDLGLNLLVMVASLTVFFGLAEGLARLAGYTPYTAQSKVFRQQFERDQLDEVDMYVFSPSRVWDLRPGFVGHRASWGKRRDIPIAINSQGRRDEQVSLQKPANTFRVAILGDSVAFGEMVKAKDNFATQLEWNLNARSSSLRYEVLNFGVPGYGTWQELSVLKEKALAYDPDLVIVAFVANDLFDNNEAGKLGYLTMTRVQGVAKFLRENSGTYRWMREQVLSVEAQVALHNPCTGRDRWTCWDTTRQLLDQMVEIAHRRGIKLVLAVFPLRQQTFEPKTADTNYQEIAADYAREKGILDIDLLKAFTENRDQDLYLEGDNIHPSETGYSIMTIEILEQLDAQSALPTP